MRRRSGADAKPRASAWDKALALLARREYSCRELRERLGRGGYPRDEIDAALERLIEQGYQSDERFAAMLVRGRAGHGYGPLRIRVELASHGIDEAVVEASLDEAGVDWDAVALALVRRRRTGGAAVDYAARARDARFLLRRGFAAATVRRATHAEFDESADA